MNATLIKVVLAASVLAHVACIASCDNHVRKPRKVDLRHDDYNEIDQLPDWHPRKRMA